MSLLPRLFKKRAPEAVAPSKGAAAELPLGEPAYYEVWGGLESANRALWVAVWFSTAVAILCLIMVRALLCRPPVVIRVTDSGVAQAVAEPGRQPPVGEAEIKNFISLFERFFLGLNVYTYDSDLKLAFSMMTQGFQSKANDMLKRDGTVENLKVNQSRVTVTLTDLKVIRDTPDILECKVLGNRHVDSFKPEGKTGRVVFEDDIILRKVPRSEQAPYGVLVEDFHESVYENTLAN